MAEKELDVIIKAHAENMAQVEAAQKQIQAMGIQVESVRGKTAEANKALDEHAKIAKEAAAGERDIAKEGGEAARAMGEMGARGGEVVDRFMALGGVMGSGGALGIGLGAAIVGVGGLVEGVKSIIEISEAHETSVKGMEQAYQSAGLHLELYKGSIDDWLDSNARFIADQNVARDGFSQMTRAGLDQNDVMRAMNEALDLAALKHIDLSTAEHAVLLGLEGNGRALKDLGIDLAAIKGSDENITKAHKELEAATKNVTKASDELTKAQDALNLKQDELAGKHKLTAAEADQLASAHKRVDAATQNLTKATNDQTTAQDKVANSMTTTAATMDQLDTKLKDGRNTESDLTQQTQLLNKHWDDLANRIGPTMIKSLAEDVGGINDAANAMGNLFQKAQDAANAMWNLANAPGAPPSLPRGVRQHGGPVMPGGVYTVGEAGPETLVMGSRGGVVIPNSAGGGSTDMSDTNELLAAILMTIQASGRSGFSTTAYGRA